MGSDRQEVSHIYRRYGKIPCRVYLGIKVALGLLSCWHQALTALPGYGVHSYTLLLHKYVSLQRHTATLKLPDGNTNTVTTELHRLTGKRTAWHGKSTALHMPSFEKGDKLTAAWNRCGNG